MHWPLLTLSLMFIAVGVLMCAAMVALAAWALVHPPRMTDGKALWLLKRLSPMDLGLEFEDVSFFVHDRDGKRLKIASWWIPNKHNQGRCAVLIHGYADAKVGVVAWAPIWHALGFNLLVPDLRAHGESEGSICTGGYLEREDVRQVLDELIAQKPSETRQMVLFGVSMGAAVALAVAEERSDLTAIVLDSPYADFRSASIEHMYRLGLPFRRLAALAVDLAEWFSNSVFDDVAPVQMIPRIRSPLLIIASGDDSLLSQEDRPRLQEAIANLRKNGALCHMWDVPEIEHLMAMSTNPLQYRQQLDSFLNTAFASAKGSHPRYEKERAISK